ncbi:tubby C-terminal domain-like protein [Priestia endophytica]|uniref:tubby C-terminal domain-like protein n=1 Tax=Priestia endophytica TaxID=135735 RepID=UPI00124C0000|nr:hypothetical protein [Priestia endophytica]KAB2488208.1 hypothetical protein F8155_25340 [Priestia endophytica]
MKIYKFTSPLLLYSTKPFTINDEQGNKVGELCRYFSYPGQSVLSRIINMTNVKVYDTEKEICFNFKEKNIFKNLIFNKWDVTFTFHNEESTFELQDKTKIKTNQKLLYTFQSREMEVKAEIMDRVTRFYRKTHNQTKIVAQASYDRLMPPIPYTIEIYDEDIHFGEIIGILYLMRIHHSD